MKPEDHKRITNKSLQIFHRYTQSNFSEMLRLNSKQVERGAQKEDSFPIRDRVTNWHFFKQNDQLHPATIYYLGIIPLPVTPTSEAIIARRIAQLKYALQKDRPDQLREIIGRVLHHVQDMSTPAHVVPIYHGPGLHDSFEDYSIDHSEAELQTIDINAQEYEDLRLENNNDIMSIYTNAAHRTLHYLYDDPESEFKIENMPEYGWDLFWKRFGSSPGNCASPPYAKIPGFGCYGPLGEKYGAQTIELNGTVHKVNPTIYRGLHRWVLHQQIIDTLRTLLAINSLQHLINLHR